MAIFDVRGGSLTAMRGQMFGVSARNAAGLPAPNIALPGRPIALPISFFIRYFLAKSTFFSGELHCFSPGILVNPSEGTFF
jgi:hypothetical protein